jgi:hypothetical protein
MIRFSKVAAALAVVPVIALSGTAIAGSPGQLGGGDNYTVKNLTQKGSYGNNISATCKDEVQYSMELSNTEFGALNNVTLKVSLPSNGGVSTATATTDLGGTSGASDSATLNLGSGQTQALVNGSTTLFDDQGHAIKTLPDTIATSGVNIGTLKGSTIEFVNFKAKVNCPTPTPTPTPTPAPTPTPTPAPAKTPEVLPNTGAGDVLGAFAGASAAGTAAHVAVRRVRRNK